MLLLTTEGCLLLVKDLLQNADDGNFHSLTGLLSFMLSDEMTTGSVTTSDADKRAYAARSHTWNLESRRFKEAFPDVSPISHLHFAISLLCPHSVGVFDIDIQRMAHSIGW